MAKGSNVITHGLSGNLGEHTLVKSKRYGPHLRRKRGTVKPAPLNDQMKQSTQQMAKANIPAKAIFDAVRQEHKDGELWNKLVALFRNQQKAGIPYNTTDLKGLECHSGFKLQKLMPCTDQYFQLSQTADRMCLLLTLPAHPDWSHMEWKEAFQYRLSAIAVYPDWATGGFVKETVHGPITEFTDSIAPFSFEWNIPAGAGSYIVFLLAAACEKGRPVNNAHAKGMRAVAAGTVNSLAT